MRPIRYEEQGDIIRFFYDTKALKEWIRDGNTHGDVGFILLRKEGKFLDYAVYGTIEHPVTTRYKFRITHLPAFDGEWNVENIMNPKPFMGTIHFQLLDLN